MLVSLEAYSVENHYGSLTMKGRLQLVSIAIEKAREWPPNNAGAKNPLINLNKFRLIGLRLQYRCGWTGCEVR